jgi:hypothetical protein
MVDRFWEVPPAPNETTVVGEEKIRVSGLGATHSGTGRIEFRLLPRPRMVIEVQFPCFIRRTDDLDCEIQGVPFKAMMLKHTRHASSDGVSTRLVLLPTPDLRIGQATNLAELRLWGLKFSVIHESG